MDDLFDPLQKVELAMIRAEHQKRYQVMINFIKEKVGTGVEYRNSVVRMVVSETGAYYELLDLPEEFCGAAIEEPEEMEQRFIAPKEAVALMTNAFKATRRVREENTRHFSIIALYTRKGLVDRKNCYIYDSRVGSEFVKRSPLVVGKFQPDVMPLFFKIKIEGELAQEVLGIPGGLVFCMANAGDRHLQIRLSYSGDQLTDLGAPPHSERIH